MFDLFKTPRERTSNQIYFIITGPVISAINMLELAKTDDGLNLGAVRRYHDWAWSTYNYLGDRLTKRDRKSVDKLLTGLGLLIKEYDWDAVEARQKRYDGWDEAMHYYNNHF